jgi:hypothetical protein
LLDSESLSLFSYDEDDEECCEDEDLEEEDDESIGYN